MVSETYPPEVYEHLRHVVMGTKRDDKDPPRELWKEVCVNEGLSKDVTVYLDPATGYPAAQREEITAKGLEFIQSRLHTKACRQSDLRKLVPGSSSRTATLDRF